MKINDCIIARTHADFLNELLEKDYKGWMKSSYNLSDGKILWMIELGNFVSPSGWINRLVSQNRLSEKHIYPTFDFQHNTYKNALLNGQHWDCSDRVIFEIIKDVDCRAYVFRGVFKLNLNESTTTENIWDLVQDEYDPT
jgi:hypothetical protein